MKKLGTFSYNQQKLDPCVNSGLVNFKDKCGNDLVGDKLVLALDKHITKVKRETNKPYPMGDQKFLKWFQDLATYIRNGGKSEEYFRSTLVGF